MKYRYDDLQTTHNLLDVWLDTKYAAVFDKPVDDLTSYDLEPSEALKIQFLNLASSTHVYHTIQPLHTFIDDTRANILRLSTSEHANNPLVVALIERDVQIINMVEEHIAKQLVNLEQ